MSHQFRTGHYLIGCAHILEIRAEQRRKMKGLMQRDQEKKSRIVREPPFILSTVFDTVCLLPLLTDIAKV